MPKLKLETSNKCKNVLSLPLIGLALSKTRTASLEGVRCSLERSPCELLFIESKRFILDWPLRNNGRIIHWLMHHYLRKHVPYPLQAFQTVGRKEIIHIRQDHLHPLAYGLKRRITCQGIQPYNTVRL